MLEAIAAIEEDAGAGREVFLKDRRRRQAIERNLTIIGEAAKRLSPGFRERVTEIEWRRVAGLRDKLIHDYAGVDPSIVWAIVERNVPVLRRALERERGQ